MRLIRYLLFCAWRPSHNNTTVLITDPPFESPNYWLHDNVRVWFVTYCVRCGREWVH